MRRIKTGIASRNKMAVPISSSDLKAALDELEATAEIALDRLDGVDEELVDIDDRVDELET